MHAMQMLLNKNYFTHLKSNKLHMFQMLKFCQQLLNPSHSNETNVCPIEEENDRYTRHEKAISSIEGSFMSYSLHACYTLLHLKNIPCVVWITFPTDYYLWRESLLLMWEICFKLVYRAIECMSDDMHILFHTYDFWKRYITCTTLLTWGSSG